MNQQKQVEQIRPVFLLPICFGKFEALLSGYSLKNKDFCQKTL